MSDFDFVKRLEGSRKDLLEIGLRNTMVNFRPGSKSLAVVGCRSEEVLRTMFVQKKEMSFASAPDKHSKHIDPEDSTETLNLLEELDTTSWSDDSSATDAEVDLFRASRGGETVLQTALAQDKLFLSLLKIQTEANTYLEEQGVNTLFLALGFLHWYESESSDLTRKAPLLLVPVELTRKGAKNEFRLSFSDDSLVQNLSLAARLKTDFKLDLPEYQSESCEDSDDLPALSSFYEQVSDCVDKQKNWKVVPDEIHLGFFSFGKFLMYNDLDPEVWPTDKQPTDHPILRSLLGAGFQENPHVSEQVHLDSIIQPGEVKFVRDADSTQTVAILEASAGRNLVIQGPPGTGKSQTITNIIAELIGKGKTVLFVAEKMTALEVVKRRLDECLLGDAVLELHSHKSNKASVLKELDRTLSQGTPVVKDGTRDLETLRKVRNELNRYCEAVNGPIGASGTSFIASLGRYLQVQRTNPGIVGWPVQLMKDWTGDDFLRAREQIQELARHVKAYGKPSDNPFWGSKIVALSPIEESRIFSDLGRCLRMLDQIGVSTVELAQTIRLGRPATLMDVDVVCKAAQRATEAPKLKGIRLTSEDWQSNRDSIRRLIHAGSKMSELKSKYGSVLIDQAWSQDVLDIRQNLMAIGGKWWRFLSGKYRGSFAKLQGLCKAPIAKVNTENLALVDAILEHQQCKAAYDQEVPLGEALFGAQWNRLESDWNVLQVVSDWIIALYDELGDGTLPPAIIDFLSGDPDVGGLGAKIDDVRQAMSRFREAIQEILKALRFDTPEATLSIFTEPEDAVRARLQRWLDELPAAQQQVRFNELSNQLSSQKLGEFVGLVAHWDLSAEQLTATFDLTWYGGLIEAAYAQTPEISQFDAVKQHHLVEQFRSLDLESLVHAQTGLAKAIWEGKPARNQPGEMQILGHELNKKRRHLPIRKLIDQAGRAIQAIKPVFMMSPMSIANFLPPGKLEFDVVIFDEASQVKSVDAFGALLRGKQAIVVGDTQQMPPTDFFGRDADLDDEDNTTSDIESILSLFRARGALERTLNWHYRSRHESLISVSNVEFYDRKLVVFPSSGANPLATGLKFHCNPQAIYDRGRTKTNRTEAKAIAQAVIDHAEQKPQLSLGVVAFSVVQRDLILVEIELLRKTRPDLNDFFNNAHPTETFFVKNLENVQGDERDCILISIGYGRNESGRISKEFGPINNQGGARRLNVLISRAKMGMEVFSNFRADELELETTSSQGLRVLKHFLKYAQTGELDLPRETGKGPDSPFEEEVLNALREKGYRLEPQVGTAGYFIDIAVKDPEFPGRYLLAIECDGAAYHSSRSARDRDRLRQGVLESLGWRFHRIWSTDWFRNPKQELAKVVAAIESAKSAAGTIPVQTVPASLARIPKLERIQAPDREPVCASIPYRKAELPKWRSQTELHEAPIDQLVRMIKSVVEIESPIHQSEVTKRLKKAFDVSRAGNRITERIDTAIESGNRSKAFVVDGDFLHADPSRSATVRNRSALEPSERKIELVAPQELDAAILEIVHHSFSIDRTMALSSALDLLGFNRAAANISDAMSARIDRLVSAKRIKREGEILSPGEGE
ncbi:MAG TPA: DUF3320 domain-containing protein [Fibrobacteria bacterium]|nr:DUF3320 domain-containing protein [Fibrobacteria bacterium]